jgi:hypothetical protein
MRLCKTLRKSTGTGEEIHESVATIHSSHPNRRVKFDIHARIIPKHRVAASPLQNKARHDRMVALVTQMLNLHARLAAEAMPQEKTLLQRRIDATDKQIDRLVYELYGLTEDEITVVEGV